MLHVELEKISSRIAPTFTGTFPGFVSHVIIFYIEQMAMESIDIDRLESFLRNIPIESL